VVTYAILLYRYQVVDLTNIFTTVSSKIMGIAKMLMGSNFSAFNIHMKVWEEIEHFFLSVGKRKRQ
jgi:hypothetical protein